MIWPNQLHPNSKLSSSTFSHHLGVRPKVSAMRHGRLIHQQASSSPTCTCACLRVFTGLPPRSLCRISIVSNLSTVYHALAPLPRRSHPYAWANTPRLYTHVEPPLCWTSLTPNHQSHRGNIAVEPLASEHHSCWINPCHTVNSHH